MPKTCWKPPLRLDFTYCFFVNAPGIRRISKKVIIIIELLLYRGSTEETIVSMVKSSLLKIIKATIRKNNIEYRGATGSFEMASEKKTNTSWTPSKNSYQSHISIF